jgi:hypothetical protein
MPAPPWEEIERLGHEMLERGHDIRFTARGRSMHPFVRDGDVLTIRPWRRHPPRVGSVALYWGEHGHFVAHRVVGITTKGGQRCFRILGDALRMPLEEVREDQVLGSAVSLIRNGREIPIDSAPRRWLALGWTTAAIARKRAVCWIRRLGRLHTRLLSDR